MPCAAAWKLDSNVSHQMPATHIASDEDGERVRVRDDDAACREDDRADADHALAREERPQAMQHDRARDGAEAEAAEQHTVRGRAAAELDARDQRQQRDDRDREEDEAAGAHGDGAQLGRVADVAQAATHRGGKALDRKRARGRAALPTIEHEHRPEERHRVQEEDRHRTRRRRRRGRRAPDRPRGRC